MSATPFHSNRSPIGVLLMKRRAWVYLALLLLAMALAWLFRAPVPTPRRSGAPVILQD
jgi:hypothetical protein